MAELILTIDATEIIKAYKKGLSDGFALAAETPDLDTELNLNQIDTPED